MTTDTRYVVDLSDIIGIRLECRKCGSAVSRLPATASEHLPFGCGNCQQSWFAEGSAEKADTEMLIGIAKRFATPNGDRTWSLRLEFRPPTPSTRQ